MSQIYNYETSFMYGKNGTTGQYKYVATIELNSQDQQANKSNITATLQLVGNNNSGTTMWSAQATKNQPYATLSGSVSATGNRIAKYVKSTTPLTLVTWTGDIAHDNDGTKTITVKFDWIEGELVYYPASFTVATATVALPTIQRAGEISVGSKTIQSASDTLPYTITSRGNYWFKLNAQVSYTYNGMPYISTFVVLNGQYITSTYAGTINCGDILDGMANTTSATLTLTLTAYSNSAMTSSVGTKTATVSVTVNTNTVKPTVSIGTITINTTPISGVIVAGYTTLTIPYTTAKPRGTTGLTNTITATKGSVATSTTTVVGNGSVNTNAMVAATADYTVAYTITTKDSRGATATATKTVTVKGYTAPQITIQAYRCTSGGVKDDAEVYVKATYTVAYSLTGQGNTGSDSITKNGSAYTAGTVASLPEQNSAEFIVTATDRVGTVTKSVTVGPALMPLDLYDDGTAQHLGVGLAGASAEADKVKSAKDVYAPNFRGPLIGNADTATTATNANKVKVTNNAFTSTLTSYYPTIVAGTATGNYDENLNENIRFQHQTGTTATPGQDTLTLGNSTGSGTAGNQEGRIRLFSQSTGYVYIRPTLDTTGTKNIYLPKTTGTLQLAPTVVWTGTLLGGNSLNLTLSSYSLIKIYAQLSGQSLIFEMDLTQASANTSADGAFTADDKYRASGTYAYWSASRVEVHYAEVGVNSGKSTLYFRRAGYTYGTTYDNNRNNTATYYIYKVEGFV